METNNSKKKVKEFDAVKMMREIRDKIRHYPEKCVNIKI